MCFLCCGEEKEEVPQITIDVPSNINGEKPPHTEIQVAIAATMLYAAAVDYGVFRSENEGNSWERIGFFLDPISLTVLGTTVYAGTSSDIERFEGGGIWTQVTPRSREWYNKYIRPLAGSGTILYAGNGEKLYRSEDEGGLWIQVNTQWADKKVRALLLSRTTFYAGTEGDGIFRSRDGGNSWTQVNTGLTNPFVRSLVVSGKTIHVGTARGIFRSENEGDSWINIGLSDASIESLAVSGMTVYAGTKKGVLHSENAEDSWTDAGLSDFFIVSLAASGTTVYAGTWGDGIFCSKDNGKSWVAINEGLTHLPYSEV